MKEKEELKLLLYYIKVDNPEKFFNLETIKDYIQWFTIVGSFKNIFANKIKFKKELCNSDCLLC